MSITIEELNELDKDTYQIIDIQCQKKEKKLRFKQSNEGYRRT